MAHTFRKGDRVHVIAATMSGCFFVEGTARVVSRVKDVDEQYVVDFGDDDLAERFVDPQAQANPAAFVARLNDRSPAA